LKVAVAIVASKLLKAKLPCPKCPSSDAYHAYDDGHSFCYSCGYYHREDTEDMEDKFTQQYLAWRGISKSTMEFYNVATKVAADGTPHSVGFSYPNGRTLHRSTLNKEFWYTGEKVNAGSLFGMDKFPPGSAKAITITEGALDTLSAFEMLGRYPVVSVTSASSAKTECGAEYEYLDSFEKIYICFDSDSVGQKAAAEVARLFDFNKVYMVKLDQEKDANDYLTKGKQKLFSQTWWGSKRFLPEGILSSYSEFDKIIDEDEFKPSVPYPFSTLQEKTYGIRAGEFLLYTAKEGIGKTEIFRAIEYHLLKSTDSNIGIIHLEENKARSIKGLVGYEVAQPIHLPDRRIPNAEVKKVFRSLTKRDERVHIYSHFGSDDPDAIISSIRFMAGACACKYIFFDHITMAVTGLQNEDERRALDYISTRLAMMVEELDFTLFCISHENDDGLTRGSRNISKVSDLWVQLQRDPLAENEYERNVTQLIIKKNRYAGKTGFSGRLVFNPETYTLSEEEILPQ
jgi:twinkle protein